MKKISNTSFGFEPATYGLVTQCLNELHYGLTHCAILNERLYTICNVVMLVTGKLIFSNTSKVTLVDSKSVFSDNILF